MDATLQQLTIYDALAELEREQPLGMSRIGDGPELGMTLLQPLFAHGWTLQQPVLAFAGDVPPGGRLELVFDDDMHCIDAYVKPRNERRTPQQLASTSIFCECLIETTTVNGACVVCHRPKQPSPTG